MKVIDILVAICFPVITASLDKQNIKSSSAKFKGVNLKPSDVNKTSVVDDKQHFAHCMNICLFTADCLTTVFDEGLGQCSLYNSSTLEQTLSGGETAVMKEAAHNEGNLLQGLIFIIPRYQAYIGPTLGKGL